MGLRIDVSQRDTAQRGSTVCICVRVCVCFLRVSLFDYQAMCKMNLHSVSSARPLLSVRTPCLACTQHCSHNSQINTSGGVIHISLNLCSPSTAWLQPLSGSSPTSYCKSLPGETRMALCSIFKKIYLYMGVVGFTSSSFFITQKH